MKRILLYILTLSMLIATFNFGILPAEALVQTRATPAGTAVSTEAQLRSMAAGGSYYLANDITMTAPYQFPANITFNGNGHALLPPTGTNRENPILTAGMRKHTSSYNTYCYFDFSSTAGTATLENVSFGSAARPFCLYNNVVDTDGSGLALFPTNHAVTQLICTNVDFHVYLKEDSGSGNNAGFMSVAYTDVTMTNCNVRCEINASTNSYQAGGFFAQTVSNETVTLKMTNCIVLPGSYIYKEGQSGGFVAQLSGNATFTNCVNYADVLQTGGNHTGGIVAEFNERGKSLAFSGCRNYGKIQGRNSVGGIIGDVNGNNTSALANVNFNNCMNAGDVSPYPGLGERVGGLVGRLSASNFKIVFNNCVNIGVVHGPEKETSAAIGYFYDSVGQFIGGILQSTMIKDANGNYTVNNPGTGGHSLYGDKDKGWSWHYYYGTKPVLFTSCYAYGRIKLPATAKEMDWNTGLDLPTSNSDYPLTNGEIYNYGFAGTPVLIDTNSSGNYQITENNSSAWGSYAACAPEASSTALTRLNKWMSDQGVTSDYYAVDTSSSETYPYVNVKPSIYAYLNDADHKNIRILGSILTLKYNKVGFTYSMTINGVTEFSNQTIWTTAAYTTVGLKTAEQLGCKYLYETTFLNVPTDKTVVLTITPKGVLTSTSAEIVGQTYTLTFTNGKFTQCTVT